MITTDTHTLHSDDVSSSRDAGPRLSFSPHHITKHHMMRNEQLKYIPRDPADRHSAVPRCRPWVSRHHRPTTHCSCDNWMVLFPIPPTRSLRTRRNPNRPAHEIIPRLHRPCHVPNCLCDTTSRLNLPPTPQREGKVRILCAGKGNFLRCFV